MKTLSILMCLVALAGAAQEDESLLAKKLIAVSITSPADGSATNMTAIGVTATISSIEKIQELQLLVNGTLVATVSPPGGIKSDRYTFAAVDLSAAANTGIPAVLVARALPKKHKREFFGESAPVHVLVDTQAPTIGSLSPAGGSSTVILRPVLSAQVTDIGGSGVDPSSVRMTLDGNAVAAAVAAVNPGTVTVSFTPGSDLGQGAHTFTVDARDRAGNAAATASSTFQVASVLPPMAVLTAPANGSFLGTPTPSLAGTVTDRSGTGIDPASVVLRLDGVAVAATLMPGSPATGVSFTPAAPLSQGPHSVTLDARDRTGTPAATASTRFTLDLSAPVISFVGPPAGSFLNTATPILSAQVVDTGGSGVAPAGIVLRLDGLIVPAAVTLSDPNTATVSFTPGTPLGQGGHQATVDAKDQAGNAASTVSITFMIDTTAPVISITAPLSGSFLSSSSPTVTATISDAGGSGVDPASVVVLLNGAVETTGVSVTGSGPTLVSFAIPAPAAQGTLTVRVDAKDRAGNAASPASVSFTVDYTPPVVSISAPAAGALTNNPKLPLSTLVTDAGGAGLDPSSIVVRLDGASVAAAVGSTDPNSASVSFTPVAALGQGAHAYTVDAKDRAGNAAAQASVSFTVDITAPTIGPVSPANGSSIDNPKPSIQTTVADTGGSGVDPGSVGITVDGTAVTPGVTLVDANTAAVVFTPASGLSLGAHTVVVSAKDRAGNAATPVSSTFTVTASPLTSTSVSIPSGGATNNTQPAFTATLTNPNGTGISSGSVVVLLDGKAVTATVTAVDPSTVSISFTPVSPLSQGGHTITIQGDDGGGNPLGNFTDSFSVDTTAPVISSLSPANGTFVRTTLQPIFATITDAGGSGINVSSVAFQVDGTGIPSIVALSGPGAASVSGTVPTALSEGAHTIAVQARDNAGNAAQPAQATITIDQTPPVVSIAVTPTDPTQTHKTITVTFQDALSGVSNGTRKVLIDVVDRTTDGQFSGELWTLTSAFTTGSHSVLGEVQDAAGNQGQSTLAFQIQQAAPDTTQPSATLVFPGDGMSVPAGTTLPVVVVAKDDANPQDTGITTVDLLVNGSVASTLTSSSARDFFNYVFSLPVSGAAGASLTVQARATDGAGNVTLTSTATLTVASTPGSPPVAFKVVAPATEVAGVAFTAQVTPVTSTGTAVAGFSGVVYLNGTGNFSGASAIFDGTQPTVPVSGLSFTTRGTQVLSAISVDNPAILGTTLVQVSAAAPAATKTQILAFQPLRAGESFSQLGVLVTDAFGNGVPNVTVNVAVASQQGGSSLGQTTAAVTTNQEGLAAIPAVPVAQNATGLSVTSTLAADSSVTDTFTSSVAADVLFNIAFQHQAVEAGQPLSFTLSAIDPSTGEVNPNYTGTVYVYPYRSRIEGNTTDTQGSSTDGEVFTVTFTAADQGEVFVQDGIVLTEGGDMVLAASTVAPDVTNTATQEVFGTDDFTTSIAMIDIQFLNEAAQTVGGFSNEITVVPSKPVAFVSIDLSAAPLQSTATLVDRFNNGVFLEPVLFTFQTDDGSSTFTGPTDVHGQVTGYGPNTLDNTKDQVIQVTASSINYPSIPEAVTSLTIPAGVPTPLTLDPTSPPAITLGQNGQDVASLGATFRGQSCTPTVSLSFSILLDQESGGTDQGAIAFSAASFSSGDLELDGPLDVQDGMISGTLKNIVPLEPSIDPETGACTPANYTYTMTLQGITVDVPNDGRIIARHPDGRLNALAGSDPGTVRTLAFFGKTLTFVGSVAPAGNPALQDPSTGKPAAGVYMIDSEFFSQSLAPNAGLIGSDPSGGQLGVFRVTALDKDLTPDSNMMIRLQSTAGDGSPLTDPVTGQTLAGTDIAVPVTIVTKSDGNGVPTVLLSAPVVAMDKGFLADDAVGGAPGQIYLTSQSSVPADGQTSASIRVQVTYSDGTPAPGSTVTLSQSGSQDSGVSITQPGAADALGRAFGSVTNSKPQTAQILATVSAPGLDEAHPAFSATSSAPLRIQFLPALSILTTAPGGKVMASLVQGAGSGSPVGGFSPVSALVMSVQVSVQPESEGSFRPASFALFKGTAPQIRFTFSPSIDAFFVPDNSSSFTSTSLFNRTFSVSVVVDSGDNGDSLYGGQDPDLRIFDPTRSSDFQKETGSNSITWTVPSGSTPLTDGAFRVRLTLQQAAATAGGPDQQIPGSGTCVSAARMMCYTDDTVTTELISGLFPRPFTITATGDQYLAQTIAAGFDLSSSPDEIQQNIAISGLLQKYHLIPAGLYRADGELVLVTPPQVDEGVAAGVLGSEAGALYAIQVGRKWIDQSQGYFDNTMVSGSRDHFQLISLSSEGDFLNNRFENTASPRTSVGRRVADAGNYALVASNSFGGMLLSKADASLVSVLPTVREATSAQVVGTLAYVSDLGAGIWVFDVSSPGTPKVVSLIPTADAPQDFLISGTLALVADDFVGLEVIDLSTITSPVTVAVVPLAGRPAALDVVGTSAIVAQDVGLAWIDLSNAASPVLQSTLPTAGPAGGLAHQGSIVYAACGSAGVTVIDGTNPASPVVLSTISVTDVVYSVRVQNGTLYVAGGKAGLSLYSLTNPASPSFLRTIVLPGETRDALAATSAIVTAQAELGALLVSTLTGGVLAAQAQAGPATQDQGDNLFDVSIESVDLQGSLGIFDSEKTQKWYSVADMKAAGLSQPPPQPGGITYYFFEQIWAGKVSPDGTSVTVAGDKVVRILTPQPGAIAIAYLKNAMGIPNLPAGVREALGNDLQVVLGVANFTPPLDVAIALAQGENEQAAISAALSAIGPVAKAIKFLAKGGKALNAVAHLTEEAQNVSKVVNKSKGPVLAEGLNLTKEGVELIGNIGMRSTANKFGLQPLTKAWRPAKDGFDALYKDAQGLIYIWEAKGGTSKLGIHKKMWDYVKNRYVYNVKQMSREWIEIVLGRMNAIGDAADKEAAVLVQKALDNNTLRGHVITTTIEKLADGSSLISDIKITGMPIK